ncbi:hypothetical protein [Salinimicrobium sediminilitoris]|uniref:hypothetical protein n=1 Tax=Salinimicrobium sediminilitoris TaxID=2876715 RepID=UPI001E2BEC2F|nr:hypothetical protein [Salinimicrobium sediminilitoris]MCC8360096.1 hypothetical protein [Salinimicrobium sediminilitoris]
MGSEKFENKIKTLLEEREIEPSSQSWGRLEQRLEKKKKLRKPYLLWISSAAAVAVIFFTLGTYFNAPVASEGSQVVEQTSEEPFLEGKTQEPEVIQLATSEGKEEQKDPETEKKSSAKKPSKNVIFEPPVGDASEEESLLASEISSEAIEVVKPENELLLAENKEIISEPQIPSEVSDTEVEALLLLASAELKSDPVFTVNSGDLLHQVEYELDQSFREKVFEVVKEGLSRAKTAVANRDF